MITVECWNAGGADSYIYTELRAFAKELKKEFKTFIVYTRWGNCVGWQFKVATKIIPLLQRRLETIEEKMICETGCDMHKNGDIDLHRLTGTQNDKIDIMETNIHSVSK